MKKQIYIIAEAGVNHNGSLKLARKMVKSAAESGADAVKFQSFKAENIVSSSAPKAGYQLKTTSGEESQKEMLQRLELGLDEQKELLTYAKALGIDFLSSPFDLESVDHLVDIGLEIIKIPSGEVTNLPYLRKIGILKKKVFLSTGMCSLGEIERALHTLTGAGTRREDMVLLQCTTEYPAAMEDVNLKAMSSMKQAFGVEVGYSDHTPGIEIPIAAAALGARVLEKHFTLDRTMEGPDHKASLEPDELAGMIKAVHNVVKAMGDGIKKPSSVEMENRKTMRKSIVAKTDILKNQVFTHENLTVKRPGTGLSSFYWDQIIGTKALKDYKTDALIDGTTIRIS